MIKNIENTTPSSSTTVTVTATPSTTSSISDVQENEEEKKVEFTGSQAERRVSASEDALLAKSLISKLVTIQESTNEENNKTTSAAKATTTTTTTSSITLSTSVPIAITTATVSSSSQSLTSTLSLKTQRSEVSTSLPATSNSINITSVTGAPPTATAASVGTAPTIKVTDEVLPPLQSNSEAGIDLKIHSTQIGSSVASTSTTTTGAAAAAATITAAADSGLEKRKSSTGSKGKPSKIALASAASKISLNSQHSNTSSLGCSGRDEDSIQGKVVGEPNVSEPFIRGTTGNAEHANNVATSQVTEKPIKNTSRLSERAKKKSWYNVIYPNYKSRAEDFKKLFKDVPNDERLIVDYSCALQRDILVQGRLYVSQNYVCFHANIFSWETYVSIKWKEVTAITKEKTALVIPNAISISTANEKYFFATFTSRDKSFLMLFRVWQNTLMNKQFSPQEIWKYVHNCYGEELGLTTDDEDYIDPTIEPNDAETDVDCTAAIDDTAAGAGSRNSDSNLNQSINQQLQTSGNSSASSGGGNGVRKSKKSYFFNSGKSSANASASGSDHKTSQGTRKSNKKMKSNAKELTLSSVKPEEQIVAVSLSTAQGTTAAATNAAASANSGGSGNEQKTSKNTTQLEATTSSSSNLAPNASAITINHDQSKRKISKNNRQREDAASKDSEAVPTDVSDSSDSEENNIPFVATTECTSTHEGRQILHTILPINVETLFNLLFFSKSKFLTDFHAMRKSTDLILGEWSTNDEGQQARTVNVTVQLAASVGPKTSKVTEHQIMRDCSKPGELYSIDVNSVNAGIPYADSFSVLLHYCLVRTVDDHTMLSVHAQIKYKKSMWGVVKGFIEKNTWAGLEDFYTSLLHALQNETCIPPAKGKGRRPRRGTATQLRPIEDGLMGTAQIKTDTLEATLLPPTHSSVHLQQTDGAIGKQTVSLIHHNQQQQIQQHQIHHNMTEHKTKSKGLSFIVIFLMCCLLGLNVILLLKLWSLEERIDIDLSRRARMPNIAALKDLPNTSQEWLDIIREQEILHETELKKWHQVLQTAIELLKKVSVVCEKIYNDDNLKQQIDDLHSEF